MSLVEHVVGTAHSLIARSLTSCNFASHTIRQGVHASTPRMHECRDCLRLGRQRRLEEARGAPEAAEGIKRQLVPPLQPAAPSSNDGSSTAMMGTTSQEKLKLPTLESEAEFVPGTQRAWEAKSAQTATFRHTNTFAQKGDPP